MLKISVLETLLGGQCTLSKSVDETNRNYLVITPALVSLETYPLYSSPLFQYHTICSKKKEKLEVTNFPSE